MFFLRKDSALAQLVGSLKISVRISCFQRFVLEYGNSNPFNRCVLFLDVALTVIPKAIFVSVPVSIHRYYPNSKTDVPRSRENLYNVIHFWVKVYYVNKLSLISMVIIRVLPTEIQKRRID